MVDTLDADSRQSSKQNTVDASMISGTTNSGLDTLVEIITEDPGLNRKVPLAEIEAGAEAADHLDGLIVEALVETGVANDGGINAADVRDMNGYIQENHSDLLVS